MINIEWFVPQMLMASQDEIRGDILLGILELSGVPLCPGILAENFGVDQTRMERAFERMVEQGYVERIDDDGYYQLAPEGEQRVLTRSPAN